MLWWSTKVTHTARRIAHRMCKVTKNNGFSNNPFIIPNIHLFVYLKLKKYLKKNLIETRYLFLIYKLYTFLC